MNLVVPLLWGRIRYGIVGEGRDGPSGPSRPQPRRQSSSVLEQHIADIMVKMIGAFLVAASLLASANAFAPNALLLSM